MLDRFEGCDLVLYQAGADLHADDLLGRRIPVAWNLAGGYQRNARGSIQPVLDILNHTLSTFARSWARAWALRG